MDVFGGLEYGPIWIYHYKTYKKIQNISFNLYLSVQIFF